MGKKITVKLLVFLQNLLKYNLQSYSPGWR